MSWASILTALVLAASSATMVMVYKFEPWQALLLASGGAAVVILGLLLYLPLSDRYEVWRGFKCEARREYQALLKKLRKK